MTNKEYDSETIGKYLKKELSPAEQSAFEDRLLTDPTLAEEVKLQQEVEYGMDAYYSREQWKARLQETEAALRAEEDKQKWWSRKRLFWLAATAASLLILLTAGYFFFSSSPSAPQLFEAYYQPYPNVAAPLERSGNEKEASGPFALYEQGAYEAAVPAFEKAMANQQNPQPALNFYYAISLLETGKTNEAITKLEMVNNSRDLRFAKPARWYLALAYLKQNQPGEAKKLLKEMVEESADYREKAAQLLNEL